MQMQKYTEEKFRKTYAKCKSMTELQNELGYSKSTTRKWCIEYGLSTTKWVPKAKNGLADELFNAYRLDETVKGLCLLHDLNKSIVRKFLSRGLTRYMRRTERRWPYPPRLIHIKIIHALDDNPELLGDVDGICMLCELTRKMTNIYINKVREFLEEKEEQKNGPPKPPRRSIPKVHERD